MSIIACVGFCQRGPDGSPSSSFVVASVKSSQRGPRGWMPQRIVMEPGGQRFVAVNAPIKQVVMMAYDLQEKQVSGSPPWFKSEGFDIDAKAEMPLSPSLMKQAIQTLLQERFKFRYNRGTTVLLVEALTIDKGGLRIRPTMLPNKEAKIMVQAGRTGTIKIAGENVSMALLAGYLSGRLHRTVVNQTATDGSFDFSVELVVDQGDLRDPNVSEEDSIVHMFTDFTRRIGLRLSNQRIPLPTFTVENIERPSGN